MIIIPGNEMLTIALKVEAVLVSCMNEKQLQHGYRYAKLAEKRLRHLHKVGLGDNWSFGQAMSTVSSAKGRALHRCVKQGPKHSKSRTRFWAKYN